VGASDHGTTKSLYAKDPTGWSSRSSGSSRRRCSTTRRAGRRDDPPLDLAKEKARYGADTRGGVGISVPA
jgi:hypothetical protein